MKVQSHLISLARICGCITVLLAASCQSGTTPFYDFVGPVLEFQIAGNKYSEGGTYNAGNVLASATVTKVPVTVFNRGKTTLTFTKNPAITVTGANAVNFTVDGPFGTTVITDNSTSFLLNVNASTSHGQVTAMLNIATNNGTLTLNVTCYIYGADIVKDIYSGTSNSNPNNFVTMGSNFYFSATDGTNGIELWRSDGTSTGTTMVKDINSGAGNSTPQWLTVMNGVLYFTADDGTNGIELWKSDGTSAGTSIVKNINAGVTSSTPQYLTVMGSTLYFQATDTAVGTELFKSDGTNAGTSNLADIYGGAANHSSPANLTVVNGTLYFSATTAAAGIELYFYSVGGGLGAVVDIYGGANSSTPSNFAVVGSALYFTATNGTNGIELYKYDGSLTLFDICTTPAVSCSSSPTSLTAAGSTVYFAANDGIAGVELWKSDGTAVGSGTVRVKDINGTPTASSSSPAYFAALGSKVYFQANDGSNGAELWVSDGTSTGTTLVKDIYSGTSSSSPQYLTVLGSEIYFAAGDSTNGTELWKIDSTGAASLVRDINSGTSSSSPQYFAAFGTALVFQAYGSSGAEPYIYLNPK